MEMDRIVNCPQTYSEYVVPKEEKSIAQFFKSTAAKKWTLSNYITTNSNKYETRKIRNQLLNTFKTELEKVFKCSSLPQPIRTYANQLMLAKYVG